MDSVRDLASGTVMDSAKATAMATVTAMPMAKAMVTAMVMVMVMVTAMAWEAAAVRRLSAAAGCRPRCHRPGRARS